MKEILSKASTLGSGYRRGREDERQRVVTWLRNHPHPNALAAVLAQNLARHIEAGRHLR